MSQLLDAIAGVPNACEPIHGIVTGGQPAPEHLAALKRAGCEVVIDIREAMEPQDRKSTRLNSSHLVISYAVFCLKKKKKIAKVAGASCRCEVEVGSVKSTLLNWWKYRCT